MLYRELGYSLAYLAEPAVRHIGEGRHIRKQEKPGGFGGRMAVSARKRLDRLRWKLAPQTDPVLRAKQRQRQLEAGADSCRKGE